MRNRVWVESVVVRASLAHARTRFGLDNANDDPHEHPIEWPEEVTREAPVPHPRSDPLEVSTEPKDDRPERRREREAWNARRLLRMVLTRPAR